MIEKIETYSTVEKFLGGIYRYLLNSFKKYDIVYHHHLEVFYIILKDDSLESAMKIIESVNTKRNILNTKIEFSVGVTKYIPKSDDNDTLLDRCNKAFIYSKQNNSVVVL